MQLCPPGIGFENMFFSSQLYFGSGNIGSGGIGVVVGEGVGDGVGVGKGLAVPPSPVSGAPIKIHW